MGFDIKKAERVRRFIEKHCSYSKGEWAGQPFQLLPWQWDEIVKPLFATVNDDGYRQYRTCYVEIPKKSGKALDIETDIPTPTGWKKMRDVEAGDILFDEKGNQCRVIDTTPIMTGRPCYEIVFNDGDRIVADADHKWAVTELVDICRKGPRIHYVETTKTTGEMSRKLTSHGGQCKTFKVKVSGPIQCEEKRLPVPPYTLGAWLGDGNSRNIGLTCYDSEILDGIRNDGIRLTTWKSGSNHNGPTYVMGKGQGVQVKLKELGLIKNKHIPNLYLRSSFTQRLDLLRGLMDTDGYCSVKGQCEFTTTKKLLRDGFIELARSLGYKPMLVNGTATVNGKDCGPKYRISIFAFQGDDVFSIKRKAKRLKPKPDKCPRSQYRQIIAINRIESRPVKCIAVDSPSHLYLCGRGFIPTHNSELCAAIGLYMLTNDGEEGAEVYLAAADREQAGIVYQAAAAMVGNNPTLSKNIKRLDSRKRLIFSKKNSFMQVLSSESYSKHGISPSAVIIDEIHAHPNGELYEVLTAGTDYARRQQVVLVITTAGIYDKESIWWKLRTRAQQVKAGIIEDPRFLPVLYLADPEKDNPDDEELWKRVNPSIGQIFTLDKIRQDYNEAKNNPIDFQNFKRFRLNIPIRQLSKWMPMDKFDACSAPVDLESLKGRVCCGGLDLSSKIDLAAFLLVFPPVDKDGYWDILCKAYCPEEGILKRSRTDRVNYDIWQKEGFLTATPGNVIDYEFIEKDIFEAARTYDMPEIGFDSWNATDTSNRIMKELNPTNYEQGFQMIEMRQGAKTFNEPAKDLLVKVMGGKVRHGGNPVLRWCADNLVMRSDPNGNVAPDKEKATDKIDCMVALVMAWGRAMFRVQSKFEYSAGGGFASAGAPEPREAVKPEEVVKPKGEEIPCKRCEKDVRGLIFCKNCGTKTNI